MTLLLVFIAGVVIWRLGAVKLALLVMFIVLLLHAVDAHAANGPWGFNTGSTGGVGQPKPGTAPVFNINDWSPWYVSKDISIPVLPDFAPISNAQTMWGDMADFFFSIYKTVVHGVMTIVGTVVFGLLFVTWLLDPALRLGDDLQRNLIGPFELWKVAAAMAGCYLAWAWYVRGHPAGAMMDAGLTVVILSVMLMIVPAREIRYAVSFVASTSTVVLMAGTGQDPSSVPGPSTAPIDGHRLAAAYDTYVGSLEQIMIGKAAEGLTFGGELPGQCQGPYAAGRDLHLPTDDIQNFKGPDLKKQIFNGNGQLSDPAAYGKTYLMDVPACKPYVDRAMHPSALRAVFAWLLALGGLAFVGVILAITWPAMIGMLRLMAAAALWKFMFLRAMLPGPWRAGGVLALYNLALGVLAFVFVSGILALIMVFMRSVWASSGDAAIGWRLIAVFLVPLAFLFTARKANRMAKARAVKAAQNSSLVKHSSRQSASSMDRGDPLTARSQRIARRHVSNVTSGRALRRQLSKSATTTEKATEKVADKGAKPFTPNAAPVAAGGVIVGATVAGVGAAKATAARAVPGAASPATSGPGAGAVAGTAAAAGAGAVAGRTHTAKPGHGATATGGTVQQGKPGEQGAAMPSARAAAATAAVHSRQAASPATGAPRAGAPVQGPRPSAPSSPSAPTPPAAPSRPAAPPPQPQKRTIGPPTPPKPKPEPSKAEKVTLPAPGKRTGTKRP